jgi:hypothetical protein
MLCAQLLRNRPQLRPAAVSRRFQHATNVGLISSWVFFSTSAIVCIMPETTCFCQYVEAMRASWLEDPSSVHETWRDYFSKQKQETSSTLA